MVRDPLELIPSGLSLVTGVLDKKFNFWSLEDTIKKRFIKRLYNALVQLMNRFQDDWINEKINKKNIYLVRFDTMMTDFETLMDEILEFINVKKDNDLTNSIRQTAENQRAYKSDHQYDLKKFGLTEEQIRKDCKNIYETFLN
jgi:cellulose biosynthesis protein BcsQ